MRVISIGYGRQLFQAGDNERSRLELCSREVESLQMIVFTDQSEGHVTTKVTDRFILHPTNSKSRLGKLVDGFKITHRLLSAEKDKQTILSTQDPFEIGLIGLILARLHKVTLQVQEHADVYSNLCWRRESLLNFFRYYLGILVMKNADLIRVVSIRTEEKLKTSFGLGPKLRRLPVAVRVEAPKVREELISSGEEVENFTFLSMARFVPQKNLGLMLRAFRKVWENNKNAKLHLVGRGPEEKNITDLIKKLFTDSVEVPVKVSAWTSNPSELMSTADAYLLTSNYEGWARVLPEAIACRLPIVTTDVGCVGEVVIDGVHGRVVPVGNETLLVQAMETMINNRAYYKKIKQNLSEIKITDLPGTDFEHYGINWAQSLV